MYEVKGQVSFPSISNMILWYPWAIATLNSSETQIDTPLIRTQTFLFIFIFGCAGSLLLHVGFL